MLHCLFRSSATFSYAAQLIGRVRKLVRIIDFNLLSLEDIQFSGIMPRRFISSFCAWLYAQREKFDEVKASAMHAHALPSKWLMHSNNVGQRTTRSTRHGAGLPARAPLIFFLLSSWESHSCFQVYVCMCALWYICITHVYRTKFCIDIWFRGALTRRCWNALLRSLDATRVKRLQIELTVSFVSYSGSKHFSLLGSLSKIIYRLQLQDILFALTLIIDIFFA